MNSTALEFDVEKHLYTLRGRPLVSVTQSLVLGGLVDIKWFTALGRDRGTAVHEAVFYDIFNDLDVASLHEMIRPYIEAWFKFKRDTRFRAIKEFCEFRQFHPLYFYAGTNDIFGMLNGRHAIIDIKTGDAKTAGIQLAAYEHFPRFLSYAPLRFSLILNRDGTYKLHRHDDPNDWRIFISNLEKIREEGLTV